MHRLTIPAFTINTIDACCHGDIYTLALSFFTDAIPVMAIKKPDAPRTCGASGSGLPYFQGLVNIISRVSHIELTGCCWQCDLLNHVQRGTVEDDLPATFTGPV